MLLFPLTWIVLTVLGYRVLRLAGRPAGARGDSVLRLRRDSVLRRIGQVDSRITCVDLFPGERRFFVRLLAERNAIRDEIIALGKETPTASE